jgi:hypothetical protein
MLRKVFTAILAALLLAHAASAQAQGPFRWQAGQVLTYRVEQTVTATETKADSKDETRTQLSLLKRCKVLGVDAAGVATLQISFQALRYEMKRPGGEPIFFDSADPDKAPADLRKQFLPFVNGPLAVIRVDSRGKVIDLKDARSELYSVAKFESEPPFRAILPAPLKEGQTWDRDYQITLEPPAGTGEKYAATQHYTCKSVADNQAMVTVKTEMKSQPKTVAEQVLLWHNQLEGEVVFDLSAGRLKSAVFKGDREQKGLQGDDSTTRVQETYIEQYTGNQ